METKLISITDNLSLDCVRINAKIITEINYLQSGGTESREIHREEDFDNSGINGTIDDLNIIQEFIIDVYAGIECADDPAKIMELLTMIKFLKNHFERFRVNPVTKE